MVENSWRLTERCLQIPEDRYREMTHTKFILEQSIRLRFNCSFSFSLKRNRKPICGEESERTAFSERNLTLPYYDYHEYVCVSIGTNQMQIEWSSRKHDSKK